MAKIITAGKLDRRLSIKSLTITQDTTGAPVESWTPFASVWASRWYLRGAEEEAGDGSTQQVLTGVRFAIRFRADILTNMLLTCEGQDFNITGIEEVGRRVGLVLYATARAA